jgi:hypothetical protein
VEGDFRLRRTEDCERGCGATGVKEATTTGGDRLVVTGARAEADAEFVIGSTNDVDDASQVGPLLDQVADPIASFTADGAYGQDGVYGEVAARHPDAAVIVPPRSSAVPSATAERAPIQRDQHLQTIAERGRMGWQKVSGYNSRALVEAHISRFKRVIGGALRSRTDEHRATEVAVAVGVPNRMLELGRPEYVRLT